MLPAPCLFLSALRLSLPDEILIPVAIKSLWLESN